MSKYLLSVGLMLGSLAGLGSAAQAAEERGLAEQMQASTLDGASYREGQAVWIWWAPAPNRPGKWYPGHILEVRGVKYLVSYDGYGQEYDEEVYADRLQPR